MDWRLPVIFGDGHNLRFSVSGRGGRKNQLVPRVAHHRVQQIDAAAHVRRIKCAWLANRLRDQCFPCEMHNRVDFVRSEYFLDLLAVRQIGFDENGGGRHGRTMPFLKIVQGNHAMAAVEQHLRADASNVSGASGHKNIQRRSSGPWGRTAAFEYTAERRLFRREDPRSNIFEEKRRNTGQAVSARQTNLKFTRAALKRSNPKSKSAEQVLYLLCGAFTYNFALVMFSL